MSALEKFIVGAFGLIALYLFVAKGNQTDEIIKSLSTGFSGVFKTLQARD